MIQGFETSDEPRGVHFELYACRVPGNFHGELPLVAALEGLKAGAWNGSARSPGYLKKDEPKDAAER
jgi:hypothetical protein